METPKDRMEAFLAALARRDAGEALRIARQSVPPDWPEDDRCLWEARRDAAWCAGDGEAPIDLPDRNGYAVWYAGEVNEDGQPHGRGVRMYSDGTLIGCEFRDGEPHGQGIEIWPNGMLYNGNLYEGYPNGRGVYTWPKGERYEFDHLHLPYRGHPGHNCALLGGRGTHTLPDGTRYKGWFHNGKYHGRGVLTMPDGTRYEGWFHNGKYLGRGV